MNHYQDYDDFERFLRDNIPTLNLVRPNKSTIILDYGENGCLVFDRKEFIESFICYMDKYTNNGKRNIQSQV